MGYSADKEILTIISWGPHDGDRQEESRRRAFRKYDQMGKPLHALSQTEARELAEQYPLKRGRGGSMGWQKAFVISLVGFLSEHDLSMAEFRRALTQMPPLLAQTVLQTALGTSSTKIPHCYMRDCLKLDAFPIDRRVARLLNRFHVPLDPWVVISSCRRLGIPVRVLARAAYRMGE